MDIATLKRPSLFHGLADDQLEKIAALAERVSLTAGTLIFEEDSQGNDLWLVGEGFVKIEITLPGAGESVGIAQVGPNEILGELALLDGHRRSASARAGTELLLYRFPRVELLRALEVDTGLGFLLMKNLACVITRRLRDTNFALRSSLAQQRAALGSLY